MEMEYQGHDGRLLLVPTSGEPFEAYIQQQMTQTYLCVVYQFLNKITNIPLYNKS